MTKSKTRQATKRTAAIYYRGREVGRDAFDWDWNAEKIAASVAWEMMWDERDVTVRFGH